MQQAFNKRTGLWLSVAMAAVIGFSLMPSCKKEESGPPDLTVRDKLLGTWRRNLRAYDNNGNGVIDSGEVYHSATDTLMLTLAPDATYRRILVYKAVEFPETGTWHLQKTESELVLQPSTSTAQIDTFRLDTVSQNYFLQHENTYYEGFVR
jgi:hypothetical protein